MNACSAVANGHELLASVTGTGCMSSAITGCFLAAKRDAPLEAAAEALASFGVAAEDAARGATGPGSFHVALYDALAGLDPDTLDSRAQDLVKLHAIVDELETARLAVDGGATVVQWRLKNVARVDVVERGRATRSLCARFGVTFVVNDDVEAALMLGAEGVHLGRGDEGADRAKDNGLLLGLSASTLDEARDADERRGLHRGRSGLGDAVEGGRRSGHRARRPARDLRRGSHSGDRDRRHRRDQCRRIAFVRAPRALRSSALPAMPSACAAAIDEAL